MYAILYNFYYKKSLSEIPREKNNNYFYSYIIRNFKEFKCFIIKG